jgi:hypothetical protein
MSHAKPMIRFISTFCFCVFTISASAEQISKPYTFSSGTQAKSSDVNANFDVLYTKVNQLDTQLASAAIPAGVIVMWSGLPGNIPAGWTLCDGSNGSPDLRDKFIIATGGSYSPGQRGGSATSEVPAHTHSVGAEGNHAHHVDVQFSSCVGDCTDGAADGSKSVGSDSHGHHLVTDTLGAGQHSHGGQTGTSSSATMDNLPPYYALAFIMKR